MIPIACLPIADPRGASTRYRVMIYQEALQSSGFAPHLSFPMDIQHTGWKRKWMRFLDARKDVHLARSHPIVMIHRKTYPPYFLRKFKKTGATIVYDFDDAIDQPSPSEPQDDATKAHYQKRFEGMVDLSDLLICGNEHLAAKASHPNKMILPTPVDVVRFVPTALPPPKPHTVGWVGHSDNLEYLMALAEPLRALAQKYEDFKLVIVADRTVEIPGVPIEFRSWSLEREVEDFQDIAVGLMPLPDDDWARAKCSFKALQYMALGIPPVLSPVGMNREVVSHGQHGLHASSPEDWFTGIDQLLSNASMRSELGIAARARVEDAYSAKVLGPKLVKALKELIREES